MRVFGYIRVSSFEQRDGTSLDSQREEIERYCRANGFHAPSVRVEVESGGAEKLERRVELAQLLSDVRPGDRIFVAKTDRWSRDLPYAVASVRALVARGVGWRSIGENIDASTPDGDTALGFMSMMADMERKRIRERTVGSRRRLREMGYHVEGHAPLGYKTEGGRGKWRLVPSDETAPIVRRMFSLFIGGMSTREIANALRAEFPGARVGDHSVVCTRLQDRRYLGESNTVGVRGKRKPIGEWRPTHEALIDAETFERAQQVLAANRVGGRPLSGEARTAGFLLRGLLMCAHCGGVMAAHSPATDASVKHGGYYQCPRPKCDTRPIVRYRDADAEVERVTLVRLDLLTDRLVRPPKVAKIERDTTAAEKIRLTKRLENLVEAVADGTLTREDAKGKIADARARIDALERRKREPPKVDRTALLAKVRDVRGAWSGMTMAERRGAIHLLAVRVAVCSTATKKWERGAWRIEIEWKKID